MPDMLEKGISIAIMLFILSMIAERFVTWVKLFFGKKGRSLWLFTTKGEDLRKKPKTKEEEKVIEVKILGLNIVLSILIAFIGHANLFDILSYENPYKSLGWGTIKFNASWAGIGNFFLMLLGCILTGLFISLGSKFWHDLLDLLLYTKNLKQKLSSPETYEVTSVDQLTEYLSFSEPDLVRLAIAQNEQTLRTKFTNIRYLNDSIALVDGERRHVLGIYLSDRNSSGLPDKVPAKLPSGKIYNVGTEIIEGLGKAKIQGGMEGSVAHEDSPGYKGSACCILTDGDRNTLLLTNAHVLAEGNVDNSLFNTDGKKILYDDNEIGRWHYSGMSTAGDFGLVVLNDDAAGSIDSPAFSNTIREITKDDWLKLAVNVSGNKCKNKTGVFIIEEVHNQLQVEYRGGNIITMDDAILIADLPDKQRCRPVTDFGDSGGAVYDINNQLIGIITARDDKFTYAIPLRKFINSLQLEIK